MIKIDNPWFNDILCYGCEFRQWVRDNVSLYDTAICDNKTHPHQLGMYGRTIGIIVGISDSGLDMKIDQTSKPKHFEWTKVITILKNIPLDDRINIEEVE